MKEDTAKTNLAVVDFVGRIFVAFFASARGGGPVGGGIIVDSLFPASAQAPAKAAIRETRAGVAPPKSPLWCVIRMVNYKGAHLEMTHRGSITLIFAFKSQSLTLIIVVISVDSPASLSHPPILPRVHLPAHLSRLHLNLRLEVLLLPPRSLELEPTASGHRVLAEQ
jgi:hypothetical protein